MRVLLKLHINYIVFIYNVVFFINKIHKELKKVVPIYKNVIGEL